MRKPFPYTTIVFTATSVAVFSWQYFSPDVAMKSLSANYSVLFIQPWRVVSSLFLHLTTPHFLFNLITLIIFGSIVETRFGSKLWLSVLIGSMIVGHVAEMLIHGNYIMGLSGGVCGLYGFLLRVDHERSLWRTLVRRPLYLVYGISLLALAIADFFKWVNVANYNHMVGILFGYLAANSKSRHFSSPIRYAPHGLVAISLVFVVYRPWDYTWKAVHNRYDQTSFVPQLACADERSPTEDVTNNKAVYITIISDAGKNKQIFYFDRKGDKIFDMESSDTIFRFHPYIGSVWRIDDNEGICLAKFEAKEHGIISLK